MPELGIPAPDFSLPDPAGRIYTLADFADCDALVVQFLCNHCPYVRHIKQGISDFARDYRDRPLGVVAINSNAGAHAGDSPEAMLDDIETFSYRFPYLVDESQEVARAYQAACTPDFFVYDRERRLVYRGQFDESRPGNGAAVTGRDLRHAVDAVLAGRTVPEPQIPSIGCNIKWKDG